MRGRRQEVSALVAALALHAAALGVLRWIGTPISESRLHPASRVEDLLELDLDDPARTDLADALTGHAEAEQSAPAQAPELERFPSHATARVVPQPSETELETVEPAASATIAAAPDVAAPSKPIDLGLGPESWQRWMTAPTGTEAPQAAAPPARNRYQVFRPAPASTTGGLQEGLDEKDRARGLGLGPEGRVLSALQKAAHAPEAPETGVARFVVTVRRTGAVEVTLGAATDQHEQWQKLAKHIASDLRSSPPRIPPPHEGFKYAVEVVAEQTLPNGTKAKSRKKPHLDAPLKFQDTDASVAQATRENPTIVNPTPDDIALKLDAPGVYVAQNNGVCDYRAGVGSIATGSRLGVAAGPVIQGACDPTNIGAKSQRIVRTRVVAQSLF